MQPALRIEELRKSYGSREALRGLSLEAAKGTVLGLLGPNGAGKTTTLSIVGGILTPSSGRVEILGETMEPDNEKLRRRMGVVYDSQNLFEYLTAEEHLTFTAAIHGVPEAKAVRRRGELLGMLGLREAARVQIGQYSHGMKKKTALACALIHDPELLLLDEPFEGMDTRSTLVAMDNLRALARRGTTVIVTSHILSLVEKCCDEVAIVTEGQLAWQQRLDRKDGPSLEEIYLRLTGQGREAGLLSWVSEAAVSG